MLDRNYFGHRIPGGTYYWDHFRRFGIEDWVSPYASEILATNTYVASDYSGGTRRVQRLHGQRPAPRRDPQLHLQHLRRRRLP